MQRTPVIVALAALLTLAMTPALAAPVSTERRHLDWAAIVEAQNKLAESWDPANIPIIDIGYNLTDAKIICKRPSDAHTLIDDGDRATLDSLYWSIRLCALTGCLNHTSTKQETANCVAARALQPVDDFRPIYGLDTSTYDVAAYIALITKDNTNAPLHKPMIILGFRGTSNVQEMLLDVQGWQTNCSSVGINHTNCLIHEGFSKGFNAMRTTVSTILKDMTDKNPSAAIRIVGHSLGGALAAAFAPDIAQNYSQADLSLYTFGNPRVFSPGYSSEFRRLIPKAFRMTNYLDPVPHLPPNSSELGEYAHVGAPYFTFDSSLGSCGHTYLKTVQCTRVADSGEDTDCQNTLWNFKASLKSGLDVFLTGAAVLSTWGWHDRYLKEHVPVNPFPGKW